MTFQEQIREVISTRRKSARGARVCSIYYFQIPICVLSRNEKIEADLRQKLGDDFPQNLRCEQVGGVLNLYVPFPDSQPSSRRIPSE